MSPPRPTEWHEIHPSLRLLPFRRQGQTRAHRLPHRSPAAARSARPTAAQGSPSTLHLPVLRWGNETDCQLPPKLARPSRPAAAEETPKPRQMTVLHQLHSSRRFRFPGLGADELCPRCEKQIDPTPLSATEKRLMEIYCLKSKCPRPPNAVSISASPQSRATTRVVRQTQNA